MHSALDGGASSRARLLVVVGFAALLVGVLIGRPALLAFAAVALIPLLLPSGAAEPTTVCVAVVPPTGQLSEGVPVDVAVRLTLDQPAEAVAARIEGDRTLRADAATASCQGTATGVLSWLVTVIPARWGPAQPPRLTLSATSRAGLRTADVRLELPVQLVALPYPAPVGQLTSLLSGRARSGNHVAKSPGEGVEFAGVRPFAPGDSLRRVHWAVSSRRGQLYVTERAAEAAVEVVVVIDALVESGPPGASTLDISLRGAAGLSRALLADADRVGLVLLGGVLAWLSPVSSSRSWYQLMEGALRVAPHESFVTPDIDRIPRVALPPGALVVLFTPLLDERVLSVCADLRRRRFTTVVLNVLQPVAPPRPGGAAPLLGDRLWRLHGAATTAQLRALGCLVTTWDGAGLLDVALTAVLAGARGSFAARVSR